MKTVKRMFICLLAFDYFGLISVKHLVEPQGFNIHSPYLVYFPLVFSPKVNSLD